MRKRTMTYRNLLILALLAIMGWSCQKTWDEYYSGDQVVGEKLIDAIGENENYSVFVQYLNTYGYDTLLQKSEAFTLFIPVNAAFEGFDTTGKDMQSIVGYHIAPTVLLPSHVKGQRKLMTYINKFAFMERIDTRLYIDGLPVSDNSLLHEDGIYYELDSIAYPRPNLYEYMKAINPLLARYIDSQDSVAMDYALSTPDSINSEGEIVYDSVFIITNIFEREYFPVTQESRDETATFFVVSQDDYNHALDIMADNLGDDFTDHTDIPLDWQNEFLIPNIFRTGVFDGSREYSFFITDTIETINGELIPFDYTSVDPDSRFVCSNGVAFEYSQYRIPEALYLEELLFEGEDFVIDEGGGFVAWNDEIVTVSDNTKSVDKLDHTSASGGFYIKVDFQKGSTEEFSLEFTLPKIFPGNYDLFWRGYYRPSGIIAFYVNDEYVGEFDNYNFRYPVQGSNPDNYFNKVSFPVTNINTYEDITVRMVYTGPGIGSQNGVNIDYISLVSSN